MRQGQRVKRPDLGRNDRERAHQEGATKECQEQPVVEALQQIGSQVTTEGMMKESVLETSPASMPRPRGHRHEGEGENQQGKGLGQQRGQETNSVGTGEDEQSQELQQQVDLAENNWATASLLAPFGLCPHRRLHHHLLLGRKATVCSGQGRRLQSKAAHSGGCRFAALERRDIS
jgi:hypothetical protein